MAPTPSGAAVVSLLRSMLRVAGKFKDYNIREYAKKRTVDGFREKKSLSDSGSIAEAFADGEAQFEVMRRQAVVYSLYAPEVKSIMETEK